MTTDTKIDTDRLLDDLVAAVRKVALEHPARTYQQDGTGCSYVPDEKNPDGCIVGAASRAIGHDFADYETSYLPFASTVLRRNFDAPPGDLRVSWLDHVQQNQDDGNDWARAVTLADNKYPEVADGR